MHDQRQLARKVDDQQLRPPPGAKHGLPFQGLQRWNFGVSQQFRQPDINPFDAQAGKLLLNYLTSGFDLWQFWHATVILLCE